MSLDIGGAETHIVELALELARRGVEVCVASNGGVYVPVLEKAGIRHLCVPLHSKNPVAAIRSYRILYREIKRGGYDIVHAHARIPSFVCGLLAKRLHFRLVTTCHGVYAINFLWKHLADWGERSLAVSCDIKDYLIRNYHVPAENVTLTINGIDSDRFRRDPSVRGGVCSEFGLDPSCGRRIIYVSRIDRESAHVAFMLCELMPALSAVYEGLELLIVGDGTAFDELTSAAAKANEALSKKAVFLTGARTDLPRLLSACDIFCGVSRAALEAMASGLPVILAGSQGRIGVFNSSRLRVSLDTNFCCRGCPLPTPSLLRSDLDELLVQSPAELQSFGEYNRSIVTEYYPISRMADDALSVYGVLVPALRPRHGEIVISGYYGFGNTGDDSLLSVIVNRLRAVCPGESVTVLSKRPRDTARYCAVRSIRRFNLFAIVSELKRAKLFINGSGNLFQNGTSTRSLIYYTFLTKLASRLGCKTMVYAGGIGPLEGDYARSVSRETLDLSDRVTLREKMSLDVMRDIGADTSKTTVTADPAYLIKPESPEWISYVVRRERIPDSFFIVALRDWDGVSPDYEASVAAAVSASAKLLASSPVFVAMQRSRDLAVCSRVASLSGGTVLSPLSAPELVGIFSRARLVIGMRLHTLVYAAVASTPFVGLAYDMKIKAMTAQFGLDCYVDVRSLTSDALLRVVSRVDSNRALLKSQIARQTALFAAQALTDAKTAEELLR